MKFKKLMACAVSLAVAAAVIPQTAFAAAGDTGEYQGFSYEELEDGTLAVTGYSGNDAEITIPSEIEGKKVTAIGDDAFSMCKTLTAVNIPEGVTTIGYAAFYNCSISKITLPNSLTTIGDYALNLCSHLTEITLPEGLTTIGFGALGGCTSLTEITIPASVTTIGEDAFGFSLVVSVTCENLKAIYVDENNKNYKDIDGVLYTKDGKTIVKFPYAKANTYTIPDGVTTIGAYAFHPCNQMTEVIIPDSVTTIEYCAFSRCVSLTKITIPKSVTLIEDNVFSYSSLSTIYGYTGSYAEAYAKDNNYNFVALDNEDEDNDPANSDDTTATEASDESTSSDEIANPAETTTGTNAENGNTQNGTSTDKNEPTGVVLALLPAAFAAAGIIISRKRK